MQSVLRDRETPEEQLGRKQLEAQRKTDKRKRNNRKVERFSFNS
jgi:hypothetical protein